MVTEPFWEVDPQVALERVRQQAPIGFERNIDSLITLSKSSGADVVLFGFLQARKPFLSKNAVAFKGYEDALILGLEKITRFWREPGVDTRCLLSFPLRIDSKTTGFKTTVT